MCVFFFAILVARVMYLDYKLRQLTKGNNDPYGLV